MKKGILSVSIMLIAIALLITTTNATFTANISMKSDSTTTKIGDTVTLTISVNEKVIASNFDISYDSTILKLDGSGTSYLSVAEKDGKIACIYADMSGIGTSEFKVKFKALKETTGTSLKIENAKFRAEGQDESYTGEKITGINNAITVKVEKVESTKEETPSESSTPSTSSTGNQVAGKDETTTKTANLPKAGKETGFAIAGVAVLVIIAVVFGKKSKELSKIFSSLSVFVITLVAVTLLKNEVYAVDITPKLLDCGENIVGILLDQDDSYFKITKSELMSTNTEILDILDKNENSILDTDLVKTGFFLKTQNKIYTIVLFGDANGDGIICDTDDLMIIIEDYLGKEIAKDETKLAANLMNKDDVLDTDDLMQMINMYLGKLKNPLVISLPDELIIDNQNSNVTLASIAQIGDLVNYPVNYNKVDGNYDSENAVPQWKVWTNDGTTVKLIATATPFKVTTTEAEEYFNGDQTIKETLNEYIDTNYAKEIQFGPTKEEIKVYDGKISSLYEILNQCWLCYTNENNILFCDSVFFDYASMSDRGEIDVRPVIVLKDNILTSGQGEKGWELIRENTQTEDKDEDEVEGEVLASIAQIGDLVNYPVNYNKVDGNYDSENAVAQWKVWTNDGTTVKLIATATPFKVTTTEAEEYFDGAQTIKETLNEYIDTNYAKEIQFGPTKEEIKVYDGKISSLYEILNQCWLCYTNENNILFCDSVFFDYASMSDRGEIDVRPVIVLKDNILTSGQGEKGWELIK